MVGGRGVAQHELVTRPSEPSTPHELLGYGARIAKASAAFLVVRVFGYAIVAASAWNGWMNVLQYVVPIVAIVVALRVLFRALKPRRSRTTAALRDLKAKFA